MDMHMPVFKPDTLGHARDIYSCGHMCSNPVTLLATVGHALEEGEISL